MTNLIYTIIDSPIGDLLLVGDGERLHRLSMQGGKRPVAIRADWERDDDAFTEVRSQLAEYFDGRRRKFDLPLGLFGTAIGLRPLAKPTARAAPGAPISCAIDP